MVEGHHEPPLRKIGMDMGFFSHDRHACPDGGRLVGQQAFGSFGPLLANAHPPADTAIDASGLLERPMQHLTEGTLAWTWPGSMADTGYVWRSKSPISAPS